MFRLIYNRQTRLNPAKQYIALMNLSVVRGVWSPQLIFPFVMFTAPMLSVLCFKSTGHVIALFPRECCGEKVSKRRVSSVLASVDGR